MSNLIKLKQIEDGTKIKAHEEKINSLNTLVGTTPVASQIQEAQAAAEAVIYQVTSDSTDIAELTVDITNPKAGDVLIVTSTGVKNAEGEVIANTATKSAYHYDGDKKDWIACDGNVDASKVILPSNITLAGNYTTVGNISKANNNATGTFATAGKSVLAAFTEIFSKRLQPGNPTQPAASITLTDAGAKEVGTEFTPKYSASLTTGSYTYGPATGVTATSWTVTDSNSNSSDTQTGEFAKFTVGDDTDYKVSVSVEHTEGVVAKDNLGDPSDPAKQIASGTKTANSSNVTGYRKWFTYVGTDHASTIDSAFIRKSTDRGNGANAASLSLTIPAGTTRVVIAIPSKYNKALSKVVDVDGMGLDVFPENFSERTVSVEGLNSYAGANYRVWVAENANGLAATTYDLTIG